MIVPPVIQMKTMIEIPMKMTAYSVILQIALYVMRLMFVQNVTQAIL